jgi:hypothetical protein
MEGPFVLIDIQSIGIQRLYVLPKVTSQALKHLENLDGKHWENLYGSTISVEQRSAHEYCDFATGYVDLDDYEEKEGKHYDECRAVHREWMKHLIESYTELGEKLRTDYSGNVKGIFVMDRNDMY